MSERESQESRESRDSSEEEEGSRYLDSNSSRLVMIVVVRTLVRLKLELS